MNGKAIRGSFCDHGIHQMVVPKMADLFSDLLWIIPAIRPSLTGSWRM